MTHKQYHDLIRSAMEAPTEEIFIAEPGFPDWLYEIYGEDCATLLSDLRNVYEVANMTLPEMRKATGLTQEKFAQRFGIPKRSIENWEGEQSTPPQYVRLLIADALGFVKVQRI